MFYLWDFTNSRNFEYPAAFDELKSFQNFFEMYC